MPESPRYVAGGHVQADGGLYVKRSADDELLELCRSGAFAYILTSRQMGKSSLMVETARRLAGEGVRSVMIDLTGIGTDPTAEQWYRELLVEIGEQLDLESDPKRWWSEHAATLSNTQRFNQFLEQVVLRELDGRAVIFIDEIDTTLRLKYTDDFFIAIRYFHNARARNADLGRISFVLIGVAAPGDLIKDPALTPFNIGRRVELTDFTVDEARPLLEGLSAPDPVLKRVLHWTGGHPYLTLRVFRSLSDNPPTTWSDAGIDRRVSDLFFGEKSREDSNLQFVRGMLTEKAPDQSTVLSLYRDIRQGRKVADEEQNYIKSWLKLSGVVKRERGLLRVRNRIYEAVFTATWVGEYIGINWARRLTRIAAALFLFVVVCSIPLAIYAWNSKLAAERQTAIATQAAERAKLAEAEAKRFASIAKAQAAETEKQRHEAERQRRIAEQQRDRAESLKESSLARGLAAQSAFLVNTAESSELAALLAIESLVRFPTQEGAEALSNAFQYLRKRRSVLDFPAHSADFGPNGRIVLGGDDSVRIYEVESGKLFTRLRTESRIDSVAFSADGSRVATGSEEGSVQIWNVASARKERQFECDEPVLFVHFSPDGRSVSAVDWNENVRRVWNIADGKPAGNEKVVRANGRIVADPANLNQQARMWEFATATAARLKRPGPTEVLAFSPDGRFLVIGLFRSTEIWEAVSLDRPSSSEPKVISRLVSQACAIMDRPLTREEWNRYLPEELYRETCPKPSSQKER